MELAAILKARHTRAARRRASSMREQTFTPVKHRLRDNVRAMRASEIEAPALNDNGRPILTSMWIPTNAQVQEYNQTPFHAAVTFTGRTFPHVIRKLVQLYSDTDDLVYDPMLGSGTTLYEAFMLGRRVTGADLNPHQLDSIRERWRKHVNPDVPEIHNGDASRMFCEDGACSLIIMSFPWYSGWRFGESKDNSSMENRQTIEGFMAQSLRIYKEAYRALKSGGYICNILGNTYREGTYYPVTMKLMSIIEQAKLTLHYQFWNSRITLENLREPWNRSALDTNIKKADHGCGWDIHEDIIVARKP